MALDIPTLTLKVASEGLDSLPQQLNDASTAGDNLSDSVDRVTASTQGSTEVIKSSITASEKYLSQLQTKADLLGRNAEFTAGYMLSLKDASEAEMAAGASIGASIDKYKEMNSAHTEAIKMNKAFDESIKENEASLQRMGKAQQAAIDMDKSREASIQSEVQAYGKMHAAALEMDAARDAAIQKEIQNYGKMHAAALEMNAAFDKSKQPLEDTASMFEKVGLGSARAKREVIVLGHEIVSGQFSRIPGSMMVLSESFITAGISLSTLLLPLALVAAAIGTLVLASESIHRGREEFEDFDRAVQNTGNFAGTTARQFQDMANTIARSPKDISNAKEALLELAKSGRFHKEEMADAGRAATDMARATGESAQDAAREIIKLKEEGTKYIDEFEKGHHILTPLQFDEIEQFKRLGKEVEATDEYMKALGKSAEEQSETILKHGGEWAGMGNEVANAWGKAKAAFMNWGKVEEGTARINALKVAIADANKTIANNKPIFGLEQEAAAVAKADKAILETELKSLQATQKIEDDKLAAKEAGSRRNEAVAKANSFIANAKLDENGERNRRIKKLDQEYGADKELLVKGETDWLAVLKKTNGETSAEYKKEVSDYAERVTQMAAMYEANKKALEKKPDKAPERDALSKELKQLQDQINVAKSAYSTEQINSMAQEKMGSISKAAQIEMDGKAAIAMYEAEAKAYSAMAAEELKHKDHTGQAQGYTDKALQAERDKDREIEKMRAGAEVEDANLQKRSLQIQQETDKIKGDSVASTLAKQAAAREADLDKAKSDIETYGEKLKKEYGTLSAEDKKLYTDMVAHAEQIKKDWASFDTAQAQKQLKDMDKQLDAMDKQLKKSNPAIAMYGEKKAIDKVEAERMQQLSQMVAQGKLLAEDADNYALALYKDSNKQKKALDDGLVLSQLSNAQTIATGLEAIDKDIAGKKSAAAKAAFAISKGLAAAEAEVKLGAALQAAWDADSFPEALEQVAIVVSQGAVIANDIKSVAAPGFQSGGYTGDYGTSEIAGVVHGQEFVLNAAATSRNRETLEAMNAGATVNTTAGTNKSTDSVASSSNVHVHNYGATIEVEKRSDGDIAIIARREAKATVQAEAPDLIARHISNSNSPVSKALSRNTSTERRR